MFFNKVEFYKADDGRYYTNGTAAKTTEGAHRKVINSPKSVAGDVEKPCGGGIRGAEADDGEGCTDGGKQAYWSRPGDGTCAEGNQDKQRHPEFFARPFVVDGIVKNDSSHKADNQHQHTCIRPQQEHLQNGETVADKLDHKHSFAGFLEIYKEA